MSVSGETITIARRFRGPPDSANGGYACGLLGARMPGVARVRLQSPPPLEQELSIGRTPAGNLGMLRDEQIIAEAVADVVDETIPAPVGYEVAGDARSRFRWFDGHPFATCFVCGPARHKADGLCIFPGPVADRSVVAAPWVPDANVCDRAGQVNTEVMWAALDCPSWFGLLEFEPGASRALLGQLTARVVRRPRAAEECVAIGWSRGRDGRKLYGGAAVYTAAGELLGNSEAVWIEAKG